MNAEQLFGLVVVKIQFAVISLVHGITDIPGEMEIGRRDDDPSFTAVFVDRHDSGQRVLGPFLLRVMLDQAEYFQAMLDEKFTADMDEAGRKIIANTLAGRAQYRGCIVLFLTPLPAAGMKAGAALGTGRRLARLARLPVAVVLPLLTLLIATNGMKSAIDWLLFHDYLLGERSCRCPIVGCVGKRLTTGTRSPIDLLGQLAQGG